MTVWPAGLHAGHLTLETPESMAEFEYVLAGKGSKGIVDRGERNYHPVDESGQHKELLNVTETDDMGLHVCFFVDKKKGGVIIDSGVGTRIKI